MQQVTRAQRLLEHPQKVQLVGEERLGVGHVDPALDHTEARPYGFAAAEQAGQRRLALDVARLEPGQEDARQLAHLGRLTEVVLHEMLDRPPPARIAIAHPGRDLDLHVEGQRVHGAARNVVQVAAHGPEKILGPREGVVFLTREQASRHQPLG